MAVDVSLMSGNGARPSSRLQGDVDPRVMQRAAIIAAAAIIVLVGIKAGFWESVLP